MVDLKTLNKEQEVQLQNLKAENEALKARNDKHIASLKVALMKNRFLLGRTENLTSTQQKTVQLNNPLAEEFYANLNTETIETVIMLYPIHHLTLGKAIFELVKELVGFSKAPKVTGMLLELDLEEIEKFMMDYDLFHRRVLQAAQLLEG